MATKTMAKTSGDFVLFEEHGASYSREEITVLSGQNLAAGAVLGKITTGAATAAAKAGGNTGNGTLTMDATTPVLAGSVSGTYTVRCIAAATNGGTFRVENPAGIVIGDVAVGATFAEQLKFVIADGSTDFIVGDGFDIAVAAGSGKYVAVTPAANNGSQVACAVLLEAVDASAADVKGTAIVRDAVLKNGGLGWGDLDAGQITAAKEQLKAAGLVVRTDV